MLSVEEALDKILSYVHVLEPEEKPLLDALGQVLAEDVVAELAVPPLDNTAMDGYAVRAIDTTGAGRESPVRLHALLGSLSRQPSLLDEKTNALTPAGKCNPEI